MTRAVPPGLAALICCLLLVLSACDTLKLRGEGGSSSEPEIDIGITF